MNAQILQEPKSVSFYCLTYRTGLLQELVQETVFSNLFNSFHHESQPYFASEFEEYWACLTMDLDELNPKPQLYLEIGPLIQ